MAHIGFKYNPKLNAVLKKLVADVKFTQRGETIFEEIQRLRLKEDSDPSMFPECTRNQRIIMRRGQHAKT